MSTGRIVFSGVKFSEFSFLPDNREVCHPVEWGKKYIFDPLTHFVFDECVNGSNFKMLEFWLYFNFRSVDTVPQNEVCQRVEKIRPDNTGSKFRFSIG